MAPFWRLPVVFETIDDIQRIYRRIPHRPPFLWVDKIVTLGENSIETEKYIPEDLAVFQGHYPHYPLVPGVLLCEAVFQTGAILIAEKSARDGGAAGPDPQETIPVLTRIYKAKFKNQIQPGTTIRIAVDLLDVVGQAWLLKGKVFAGPGVALQVEFGCMLTAK
jgi:3-hydroxyacyl-[acyl-carrier-protein] dehydratase